MSGVYSKKTNNEVSSNFKKQVVELQQTLINNSHLENVGVGTEKNPIINNSDKVPIKHFFMESVYIREMKMYMGTAVIGAIHKHKHMCFLLSGHLIVADENGTKDYKAPCYIISNPGVKRVLYACEDSVWYNIHENKENTRDINKIEKNLVSVNYKEYEQYINNKNK
tara:strand:- start:11355 stop:11855 length:501 start_codon:yes stop_codon:yes gene_type:complete